MTASIREHSLGGLRWVVVSGSRLDAFRALGEHTRDEIRDVLEEMPERPALERFAATAGGSTTLDRVRAATASAHPTEFAELRAMASGADVVFDRILLANLRGDLGGNEGIGCSDVGWRGTRSVVAHNEDGASAQQGRFMLVTLALDGEAPVTSQWYVGFLPGNAFVATGHGLVWGINHIQVDRPAAAPGRHFVARGLQRASSLDAAISYLGAHPSAGGFTYNVGEVSTGRVASVEAAAGRVAVVEADPETRPFLWHTNHLRHLDDHSAGSPESRLKGDVDPSVVAEATRNLGLPEESRARGRVLEELDVPAEEPSPDWLLDVLTSPAPAGVYRSADEGDPLMTLCSAAVDLTTAEVTLQARGGPRVRLPLADLAAGRATSLSDLS